MNVAVGVSNLVVVPLAVAPAVQGISGILKSIRPEYRLEKWAIRIDHIVKIVSDKGDKIPSKAMSVFLNLIEE